MRICEVIYSVCGARIITYVLLREVNGLKRWSVFESVVSGQPLNKRLNGILPICNLIVFFKSQVNTEVCTWEFVHFAYTSWRTNYDSRLMIFSYSINDYYAQYIRVLWFRQNTCHNRLLCRVIQTVCRSA